MPFLHTAPYFNLSVKPSLCESCHKAMRTVILASLLVLALTTSVTSVDSCGCEELCDCVNSGSECCYHEETVACFNCHFKCFEECTSCIIVHANLHCQTTCYLKHCLETPSSFECKNCLNDHPGCAPCKQLCGRIQHTPMIGANLAANL